MQKQYMSPFKSLLICSKKAGNIEFVGGWFTADTEEQVEVIEANEGFGVYIFPAEQATEQDGEQVTEQTEKEPAEEKIYACAECGAEFTTPQGLSAHKRSHK